MAGTKLFSALLAAVLALSLPASAADWESANRAFDEGKFKDAEQQYSALAEQGATSANLFYNLGNAEFRLEQPGRAILAYERALALDPAHPEARRNLKLVRERTGARMAEPKWYDVLLLNWRPDAYVIVAAVAAWTAILGLGSKFILRKGGSGLAFLITVAVVVGLYSGFGLWNAAKDRDLGIVVPKEAVARVAPAEQSSVVGTFPAGTRVRVQAVRGDWVYCRLPAEGLGWFPAGTVERVRLGS